MRATFVAGLLVSVAMHASLALLPASFGPRAALSAEVGEIAVEASDPPPRELPATMPTRPLNAQPETGPKPVRRDIFRASAGPAPAPQVMSTDAMPHFTIAIGVAPEVYGGEVSPGASEVPLHNAGDAQPLPEALVDGKARLLVGIAPAYPDDARQSGIEGDVRLELIVGPSGAVESASVIGGVDSSLDEAALRAARRFRFDPATKSGRPVRVRMRFPIQFRLR